MIKPDDNTPISATDAEIVARASRGRRGRDDSDHRHTRHNTKHKKPEVPGDREGIWKRIGRFMCWAGMIIVSIGMFVTGFCGYISPSALRIAPTLVMTFPAWLLALLAMTVIAALTYRKALLLALITWVGCLHPILEFSPMNFVTPSPADYRASQRFTFLTYNVTNLSDLTGKYDGEVNPTLSYIMRTNADIVNVQEAIVPAVNAEKHITSAQIDSLHRLYPYIIMYGRSQMIMSKFPVEVVHTGEAEIAASLRKEAIANNAVVKPTGQIALFRVNIYGTPVTIFDLHLQSYGLSSSDKSLYHDITEIKEAEKVKELKQLKSTLSDVRHSLISKISGAAILRQADIGRLRQLIEHYGGSNIIIAGDFNDVPCSYPLVSLERLGFKQVYEQVGFGPMITYNANRFYFRIDHVLYRGGLKPLRMVRGSSRASDHYPLLTTFAIIKPNK